MKRPPRKATPRYLENAALYYLQRYASSSESLRRVLMRRVERSARAHGTDRGDGARAVDAIVRRFEGTGLLNDRAYAEMRVETLHRRGFPPRGIRARLREKGVAAEIIDTALTSLFESMEDPEYRAAINLARRRRLGPFRSPDARTAAREKDLAAMARAGFSYDVARRVVDADDPDELEKTSD